MEAERDPGGQADAGDRFGGEVLGRENDQIGGAAVGVVDVGHDVAVVLGGVRRRRGEHRLAGGGVLAELVCLHGGGGEVVFEQRVTERLVGEVAAGRDRGVADRADDGAVAVAVRLAGHPLVGAREFLGAVVQALLGDLPGAGVDDPPVQRQRPVPVQRRDVVSTVVTDQIYHHPAAVVVGVEGMEDPARVHLEPADPGCDAAPRQEADPGQVAGIPGVGQLQPGRYRVHAEGDRQVEQDHVAGGEREVVHHRAIGDRDVGGPADIAVDADDHVLDVVPRPVVGDGVQFARPAVGLGVRGEATGQRARKVARAEGVQLTGQLIRQRAGLDGGQVAPGVGDDVRVVGEVHVVVDRPGGPFLVHRLGELPGADPAVAVPLGLPVAQPHPVHHARAQEPVPLPESVTRVFQAQRVRPVAQVTAVQRGRHGAGDRQVERGDLLFDRGERAVQEAIRVRHRWVPSMREGGDLSSCDHGPAGQPAGSVK